MQLFVDVGNTRIKWAYWDGEQLIDVCAVTHRGVNFDRLLHKIWRDAICPSKVWIANVVDNEIQEALTSWMTSMWDKTPIFLETQDTAFGITNGYQQPKALGIDRWLAIIAGFQAFKGKNPVCIIDCGTCLTADLIDQEGKHLGGLLLPGIQSMRNLVNAYTKDKKCDDQHVEKVQGTELLGRSTVLGIQGGSLFCAVAYIERLLHEMQREFKKPLKTILTGGEANNLLELVNHPVIYKPNIVFEGMTYYASGGVLGD